MKTYFGESLYRLKWKRSFEKENFPHKNNPNVFKSIYKDNLWGSDESRSGCGSNISSTEILRKMLPLLWKQYDVKTFLDVPCGDYNWMKEIDKENVIYTGGDIVHELIEQNNRKYKTEHITFKVIDITQDNLPASDMIFCRDCLQHLSYENVFRALKNFKNSGSKYLLTTTFPLTLSNWDIFNGDYRPLNLRKKPFELSAPLVKIHEKPNNHYMEKDKYMYLYKLESLKIPKGGYTMDELTRDRHLQCDLFAGTLIKRIKEIMPDNPMLAGFRIFSQCDEDGIIRDCLRRISSSTPTPPSHLSKLSVLTHTFIEFGLGNGLENNTHALLLQGFSGCWIEGNAENTAFIHKQLGTFITPRLFVIPEFAALENIGAIVKQCVTFLGTENIDFLSMDVDGNDYHFMRACLKIIQPKLLCVEYNAKFPPPAVQVMRYDGQHCWQGDDYYGASLQAWCNGLDGYSLAACSLNGVNAFFVRNDLLGGFSLYPVPDVYQPPRYYLAAGAQTHPSSFSWLKQALLGENADPAAAPGVWCKLPNRRAIPFVVHSKADLYISREIAATGIWEPFETELFMEAIGPGEYVMDIGANIGWYTAAAAMSIGNAGKVIAFEPDPENFALLTQNAALVREHTGHRIDIVNKAVGKRTSTGLLYQSTDNRGDHRIFAAKHERTTREIEIISLDDYFSACEEWPTLVKSDTQGAEAAILLGAERLFSSLWRPLWFFELWPHGLRLAGADPLEVWKKFSLLGYTLFEIRAEEKCLRQTTETSMRVVLETPIMNPGEGFMDMIGVHKDDPRLSLYQERSRAGNRVKA